MSLCGKCADLVQSAAKDSIIKKKKDIEKRFGERSSEAKGKILSDPFVIMWVPGPPEPEPKPKFYPPDPCCTEYDLTVNMTTGEGELKRRLYVIPKHLRWFVFQVYVFSSNELHRF